MLLQAISKPTDANLQLEAFQTLKPTVQQLRYFYEFAQKIDQIWFTLLSGLVATGNQVQASGESHSVSMTDTSVHSRAQRLEMRMALYVELATLVEFGFYFDTFKINTPAIQNDYSFYRRAVNRLRTLHSVDDAQLNGKFILPSFLLRFVTSSNVITRLLWCLVLMSPRNLRFSVDLFFQCI